MLAIFGDVINPLEAINPGKSYGNYDVGLVAFLSNILKMITVFAGVWALITIIMAGFQFLTAAGNPEEIKKATPKIWNAIIGLLIIVASYIIAAIIGWIMFGDPRVILMPKFYGPGV